MLCKLWKHWHSYVGLCKDGPERVGRVEFGVENSPSSSGEEGPVCLGVWSSLPGLYLVSVCNTTVYLLGKATTETCLCPVWSTKLLSCSCHNPVYFPEQ